MPRWSIRKGFNFDNRNVEDISNAMRTPTTVDLERNILIFLFFLEDNSPTTWCWQGHSQLPVDWEWRQNQGRSPCRRGWPWPLGWSWGVRRDRAGEDRCGWVLQRGPRWGRREILSPLWWGRSPSWGFLVISQIDYWKSKSYRLYLWRK